MNFNSVASRIIDQIIRRPGLRAVFMKADGETTTMLVERDQFASMEKFPERMAYLVGCYDYRVKLDDLKDDLAYCAELFYQPVAA